MSFMTNLGQLEVKAEQEGLRLFHAAGDWVDHITWSQVENLLVPAIRAVRKDVLGTPPSSATSPSSAPAQQPVAGEGDAPATGTPTDPNAPFTPVTPFQAWMVDQIGKLSALVQGVSDRLTADAPTAPADPVVPVGEPVDQGAAAAAPAS